MLIIEVAVLAISLLIEILACHNGSSLIALQFINESAHVRAQLKTTPVLASITGNEILVKYLEGLSSPEGKVLRCFIEPQR